ncbi:DUF3817 domain-containing protein [Dactylosporangium sp. CA-139114]|uniref:DUF3817 domain-containing protein n=1 Tax=Dactylosporangium sp. CA-139114 TaxID=3239931 RepID=UPI003D963905
MNPALARYRVVAWIVGVLLIVLTAGTVLKYAAGNETIVAVVGPAHGFLYMVYLVLAADLARRARWKVGFTVLVLLAGTVPLLSFVAERVVTRRVRAAQAPEPVRTAA